MRDYADLIKRLNEYSAEHEMHGGITAEDADAIEELQQTVEHYKGCADDWYREACDYKAMLPHWISVTERMPKYGERVLVFGGFTMYVAYYDKNRYGGESWHKLNSKNHYCNPTHWMPLPQPPMMDGGDK